MKHTASWILWLAVSLTLVLSTRNPIYLSVILISLIFLGFSFSVRMKQKLWLAQNIRFLLTMLLISSLVNTLFTHTGSLVLFRLPNHWILIGGPITLESLVYGLINGLIIGSIYLAFNILNLALSIRQLTYLIPRAFRPIAMTVTVTLTLFPSIQIRTQEIKEAQIIRGNQMKKIRDWIPLLLPLLISSLENAVRLSESMASRGFETQAGGKSTKLTLVGLILATFITFSAWILSLFDYPGFLIIPLYFIGGGLIFITFFLSSRKMSLTRYRKETWTKKDMASSSIFAAVIIGLIVLIQIEMLPSFSYSPYPVLNTPGISLTGLLISTVPMLPLIVGNYD